MRDPDAPLKLVIVGGGTAGWLTAAFLSRQLPLTASCKVDVTLIEASDIPTIGVGEATIPSLRQTLAACGIGEAEFLKNCDATFKHGIRFHQWRKTPAAAPGEAYFHPFGDPLTIGPVSPVRQWSRLDRDVRGAFADVFSVQPEIALSGRAPKHLRDADFEGAQSYAYHLDAGKFAEFLKQGLRQRGVRQVIAKVSQVDLTESGNIQALNLDTGEQVQGDLFIDCTGFAARLLNADGRAEFVSKSHQLFVDKAVTTRIPHRGIEDINGFTNCTAQTNGWIWDIALQGRRGVGHVYSSRHIDDASAKAELARYLGLDSGDLEARVLDMRIGYHSRQWRGNCVAIGLSAGFLEPLESTGIYLTEMANWALADLVPRYLAGAKPQDRFNEIMSNHYENITDFLKLHYCLSERRDSGFWRDNVDPDTIPATLQSMLATWEDAIPSIYDFDRTTQCFSVTNYLFVLFGMGWKGHRQASAPDDLTRKLLAELSVRRSRLKQFVERDTLPNREIFEALNAG